MSTNTYKNMLDLAFIAYMEEVIGRLTKYGLSNYLEANNAVWKRFFELIEQNGGKEAFSEILQRGYIIPCSKKDTKNNWYFPDEETYPDWSDNIQAVLEAEEYPICASITSIPENQLTTTRDYKRFKEEAPALLEKLYQRYKH